MVGSGKEIPDRDANQIGLPIRKHLQRSPRHFALLIDDLEHDRRGSLREVYQRYRDSIDTMVPEADRARAAVHFLVNMVEAYYFAHAAAVNRRLDTALVDHPGDVEDIPNPKAELKRLSPRFDEVGDGAAIARELDLAHVLSRPDTCASLRTLVAWCLRAMGVATTDFQLETGRYSEVTRLQLD